MMLSVTYCKFVVPAKAGCSAKRGERPKDGPEEVSEVNHPAPYYFKVAGPRLSPGRRAACEHLAFLSQLS